MDLWRRQIAPDVRFLTASARYYPAQELAVRLYEAGTDRLAAPITDRQFEVLAEGSRRTIEDGDCRLDRETIGRGGAGSKANLEVCDWGSATAPRPGPLRAQ